MKNTPILELKSQYDSMRTDIYEAIYRVVDRQEFILGKEVSLLEKEISEYCGTMYGVGVSSGTDALMVALMALGIGDGDEVITTPYTFYSTSSAIIRLGARPVYVDIIPGLYCIDPSKIEENITERTEAILPVQFAGQVYGMSQIKELSEYYNIPIIEDACQSIGSMHKGKKAGSFGDVGCFSFYPSKNLGGYGDSGMVVTNNKALETKMRAMRNHGQAKKNEHQYIGGNFRMDELQASILRAKLKYLDEWIDKRKEHAFIYNEYFKIHNTPIETPYEFSGDRHTYHLYLIQTERRDELMAELKEQGIGSEIYYPTPLHLQPCFKYLGYKRGDFPISELTARTNLAIPIYPEIPNEDIERIATVVDSFLSG